MGNTVLTLHFDHHILPAPDQTIILTSLPVDYVQSVLHQYFPDRTDIRVLADQELESQYPDIDAWHDTRNLRGTWLKQQALKFAALDWFDSDVFLWQDPDTFCIQPYQYIVNNQLNLFAMSNTSQYAGYYAVIENALGIPRQTTACFVSEIMPVFKQDWISFRQQVETVTQRPWLLGILEQVPYEKFGTTELKWISEYELLGNWTMHQHPVGLVEQKRFHFNKSVQELESVDDNYNCVCDKGPNGQIKGPESIFPVVDNVVGNLQAALDILKNYR